VKFNAQFPTAVWDGKNQLGTRSLGNDCERSPEADDWDQICAEVKAVQTLLLGNLTGAHIHTFANGQTIGGVPVLLAFTIADSSGDTTIVVTQKLRVIDVWTVKTTTAGGSGDTVTLKKGSTAITDAISLNHVDKSVTRLTTLDDAQTDLSAGDSLTVTAAKSTSVASIVYVLAVPIP
jgi:hypothetical protein